MVLKCLWRIARRIVSVTLALMMISFVSTPAWAVDLTHQVTFNIPPQRLSTALLEFSHQAKVQIIVGPEVGDRKTDGVYGIHSIGDALTTLLGISPLAYRVINDTSITVGSAAPSDNSPLRVSAEGSGGEDSMKEGERDSSGGFRVAQVDQGKTSSDSSIEREDEQASKKKPAQLEEVVVTGTNIRGAAPAGSPVYSYSRGEIDKAGVGSVTEFLQTLPQNFTNNGPATINSIGGNTQNISAGTSVNLRGIGTDGTLVLLNGRRPAPSAFGTFIDVSSIPLSAVERIDVLPDGASAIYGSDAVGGVVNFILKRDYDGAESRARMGWLAGSSARDLGVSQSLGHSWVSGSALLSLDFSHRDALSASDRSYPSVLHPYSLEPTKQGPSALFSGHQALASWLEVGLDALYSEPKTTLVDTFVGQPTFMYHVSTPQYAVNGSAAADLGHQWAAELDASAAGSDLRQEFSQPGTTGTSQSKATVNSADLKVDGPVFALSGGPLRLAIGGGGRRENYYNFVSYYTQYGIPALRFDRTVSDAFAELNLPVLETANHVPGAERLVLAIAVRHEHYSDAGNTTNPKYGVAWQPLQQLEFRGTYGTSFNTAKFYDTNTAFNSLFIRQTVCPSGPCVLASLGGNRDDYRPQTAKTLNFGLTYRPNWMAGLRASADYYHIVYEDRIGVPPTAPVILANASEFPGLVQANPSVASIHALCASVTQCINLAGPLTSVNYLVDGRKTNLGNTRTSGIDIDLSYVKPVSIGQWNVDLHLIHSFEFKSQLNALSAPFNVVDRTGYPTSTRLRGGVGYARDGISVNGFVNYLNGYTNDLVTPNQHVSSWTTVDLTLQIALERWLGAPARNTSVIAAAQNLLNSQPPYVRDPNFGLGFDPNNANPDGRIASLEVRKQW